MAFDPATVSNGDKCAALDSKGTKWKIRVTKNDKRAKTITGIILNKDGSEGKTVTVGHDRCRGLQGRGPANGKQEAQTTPKETAAPKAAPAVKSVATSGNGKQETQADLLERLADFQTNLATATNALYDIYEAMTRLQSNASAAPAKSKGKAEDDTPDFG